MNPAIAMPFAADPASSLDEASAIAGLARGASIEINHADMKHLAASQALLAAGTRVFISHLPGQTWEQTIEAAAAVRQCGFEPVPHIPARLVPGHAALDRLVAALAQAGAKEVLLIAGDYPQAQGPFDDVIKILSTEVLNRHGFERVSLAGHPEGHAQVELDTIRRAERDKARLAASLGLQTSLVTQFFFEADPFLQWSRALRNDGVTARLVGGIAAPASISTLFRYAMRCGVGPSIRALGAKPSSVLKLLGDYGPEPMVRQMAREQQAAGFDGLHLFCFGGFLRACQWLNAVGHARFTLAKDGFKVSA